MKLFNSLSRKIEVFKPIKDNSVGLYTCGPTVYSYAHIGNLRAFIFADSLVRVLRASGYTVKQVMNITDVGHLTSDADSGEDKLEAASKKEGKTAWDIAKFYESAFLADMKELEVSVPNKYCRATEHIKEQINLVKKLEEKGYTYKTDDGIYFDTSKFKDYGKMSTMDLSQLKEGARIGKNLGKKNPTDFALWKFSGNSKRDMEWNSPWGVGFPGWHVECSAMSMKYLGETFDIHTGGVDHLNIHHPNEIAQSEGASGKKFVKYWLHNEFLILKDGKMSKSKGNVYTLQGLKDKGYLPMHFKYFCLGTHYRQQIMFSYTALDTAKNSYERIKEIVRKLGNKQGKVNHDFYDSFMMATREDLNIPQALAELWNLLRSKISDEDKLATVAKMDEVLGLDLLKFDDIPASIMKLVNERETARKAKDFTLADKLRDEVAKKGFIIQDTKDGVEVKRKI